MGFLVEKQIWTPTLHPMMNSESWLKKDDKLSLEDAKASALEYATKIEKGKYRVRDIYTGKVLFEVSS